MRAVYSILFLALSFVARAEEIDPQHELLAVARADDPVHPTEVIGKKDLLTRRGSPASTIKVALALMALQEKVIDLKSSYLCSDRTPVPSLLTLQQAMASVKRANNKLEEPGSPLRATKIATLTRITAVTTNAVT